MRGILISVSLLLAAIPAWTCSSTYDAAHEDIVFPPPVVLYLLPESDEYALDATLAKMVASTLRDSPQHATAISLWQEPLSREVCYQIAWEDGSLYPPSSDSMAPSQPCDFLRVNSFTFDSDEITSLEWMDSSLLIGSRARYSAEIRGDDARLVPLIVVSDGSARPILTGRIETDFLRPLLATHELPITMVSLRVLEDQGAVYVTIFGGSVIPRSSVRVPNTTPASLTFEDYLQAQRDQQSEHVS
jgi:hypothetical protein